MSSTVASVSGLSSLANFRRVERGIPFHRCKINNLSSKGAFGTCPNSLFFSNSLYQWKRKLNFATTRPLSPIMEWQDCSSEIEVDVPCSVAYDCYSDRELIPQWMPFISSVKILPEKPDLSRWSIKYEVFGKDIELSWLARNMQPIPNQKIHWRSLEGLPNRGAVRFFPKGPSSCRIELTTSYEVPQILIPASSALNPLIKGLLSSGLERFASVAKNYQRKIPHS